MKQSTRRQNWTKQTNKEKREKHEIFPTRQKTRTRASTESGEIQFTPQRGIYIVKTYYCLPYSITVWKIRGQTVTQDKEKSALIDGFMKSGRNSNSQDLSTSYIILRSAQILKS